MNYIFSYGIEETSLPLGHLCVVHKVIIWNTCETPFKCHYCPDKFTLSHLTLIKNRIGVVSILKINKQGA